MFRIKFQKAEKYPDKKEENSPRKIKNEMEIAIGQQKLWKLKCNRTKELNIAMEVFKLIKAIGTKT